MITSVIWNIADDRLRHNMEADQLVRAHSLGRYRQAEKRRLSADYDVIW
jgi:hypothetical protein